MGCVALRMCKCLKQMVFKCLLFNSILFCSKIIFVTMKTYDEIEIIQMLLNTSLS